MSNTKFWVLADEQLAMFAKQRLKLFPPMRERNVYCFLIKSTSSGERESGFGKLFAKGLALAWVGLHFPFLLKV